MSIKPKQMKKSVQNVFDQSKLVKLELKDESDGSGPLYKVDANGNYEN